jgi:hypothetical protein
MYRSYHLVAGTGLAFMAVACGENTPQPLGPGSEPSQRAAPAPAVRGAIPTQQSLVHLERIGDPIWRPVDFHLFSAPIGSPSNNFEGFFNTVSSLLPEPNHEPHPQLTIGPGAPHAPPYESELAQGVAALGFEEGRVFDASEFSGTNGIYFVWMTVPDPGTTGSSPDFASGPIIPNTLFPITITGVSTRNGKVFDAALANSTVPPLDDPTLTPSFDVQGHSHFPFFIAEATIFGPGDVGPAGNYKYTITMADQQGNGWAIHTHFVVKKKG